MGHWQRKAFISSWSSRWNEFSSSLSLSWLDTSLPSFLFIFIISVSYNTTSENFARRGGICPPHSHNTLWFTLWTLLTALCWSFLILTHFLQTYHTMPCYIIPYNTKDGNNFLFTSTYVVHGHCIIFGERNNMICHSLGHLYIFVSTEDLNRIVKNMEYFFNQKKNAQL